jgi:hypothetical protein
LVFIHGEYIFAQHLITTIQAILSIEDDMSMCCSMDVIGERWFISSQGNRSLMTLVTCQNKNRGLRLLSLKEKKYDFQQFGSSKILQDRRKIRLIKGNAKCRHLKNLPEMGLCGLSV